MPRGDGGAAIFVAPRGLQKKSAADLPRVGSLESEFAVAVARQQFHGEDGLLPDAFLPAGAGDIEKRLLQSVRGHHKRAGGGARGHRAGGGIEERVHLLLVLRLAEHGKIKRNIVNSPADGKFSAAVRKRQVIHRGARLHQRLAHKLIPIAAQADLRHPVRTQAPVVLHECTRQGIGDVDVCIACECRVPNLLTRRVEGLDFAACALLIQHHDGNICAR